MARTYRQLDLDQRRTLVRLVVARRPVGEIAERLGRHRSTIYRELGCDRFRDGVAVAPAPIWTVPREHADRTAVARRGAREPVCPPRNGGRGPAAP